MMEEMTKKETDPVRMSMLVHKGQFFTEIFTSGRGNVVLMLILKQFLF